MINKYKTNNCGELNLKNVGNEVRLSGWIQRIRNLGGMTFIDLRRSIWNNPSCNIRRAKAKAR